MLRTVSTTFGTLLDLLHGPAGLLDDLPGRLGELRRGDVELLGELAVAEDLHAIVRALDQAGLTKHGLIDRGAVVEALQIGDVHDRVVGLEDIGEAALRQTAMQRHLAAFKTALAAVAGAGLLSLLATAGRLAMTRARTATDALLGVPRALFRFQIAEFHR